MFLTIVTSLLQYLIPLVVKISALLVVEMLFQVRREVRHDGVRLIVEEVLHKKESLLFTHPRVLGESEDADLRPCEISDMTFAVEKDVLS